MTIIYRVLNLFSVVIYPANICDLKKYLLFYEITVIFTVFIVVKYVVIYLLCLCTFICCISHNLIDYVQ